MNSPKPGIKVDLAHSDNIWAICWLNDNKLATGSIDGVVKLWELDNSSLKCVSTSEPQKFGVVSLKATSNGESLLASFQDSVIRIYQVPSLEEVS